ncbi:transposase IS4 family protein [Desulfatibacillum aliphaticivorans]|uniref:Transposase IS4 family protein n=1 Tax=Desulfatibacillum aliphaticivorans TaxID=218208 RepID=B8FEP3_DESAL|nr:IS4 family transposase [Desulfatibacillum aliphaticivorans]ACL01772.1 transposase IS4 family protein [Desulfatibacillum aliphaticivorans]ACL03570.1 transposase IS4 family protein [Desulfatibacillum aliphaticivorans]ACL05804.1 transposase IS4 family protein [Desulfatibacillum aliphaticivorans]
MERFLPADKSQSQAPFKSKDFSRNRILTLPVVLALILNMVRPGKRVGYDEVLARFFAAASLMNGQNITPPDKSAFCRARKKVPFEALTELYGKALEHAKDLAAKAPGTTWRGRRVLAIDGTKIMLPRTKELLDAFGKCSHGWFPQTHACVLYDVLAGLPLDVAWGHYKSGERGLARDMFDGFLPGDILVLDRGFPGFAFFLDLMEQGIDFIVRLRGDGQFAALRPFLQENRRDQIIEIPPTRVAIEEYARQGKPAPGPVTLRFVKVSLGKGKSALYATTLVDRKRYKFKELKHLYHLRWQEEEFFKHMKDLLEAENIRGKSEALVDQEIVAVHLYHLLARILIMESALRHEIPLAEVAQRAAFYATARVLDFLLLLDDRQELRRLLKNCLEEISRKRYKRRPGRKFPRKSKSSYGKWGIQNT